jgi:hypothetical protein
MKTKSRPGRDFLFLGSFVSLTSMQPFGLYSASVGEKLIIHASRRCQSSAVSVSLASLASMRYTYSASIDV